MNRVWFALFPLLLLSGNVAFAEATAADEELAQQADWKDAFVQAEEELVLAKRNLADAKRTYKQMRHRRRFRGERKRQVIADVATAKTELADAQEALNLASIAARQAGVPPGWFRENRDPAPASQTQR